MIVPNRRAIGVDFGTKRIGLAISDPLNMFAQVEGTYSIDGAVRRLEELLTDPGFSTIVVGWPLTPEGEEGEATKRVQPFVNRLRNLFREVEVVTWDERHSSERAVEALIDAGVGREARRKKGRVDAAAAALILQEYLDAGRDEAGSR